MSTKMTGKNYTTTTWTTGTNYASKNSKKSSSTTPTVTTTTTPTTTKDTTTTSSPSITEMRKLSSTANVGDTLGNMTYVGDGRWINKDTYDESDTSNPSYYKTSSFSGSGSLPSSGVDLATLELANSIPKVETKTDVKTDAQKEEESEALKAAKLAVDNAFKVGKYKGGYVWDPSEAEDYFNDYSTWNGLYNQLYKDYGLTAAEGQAIGKYIDSLAGSSSDIRSFYDAYGNDYDKNLTYSQNVYLAKEQEAQNAAYQAKLAEIARQEELAKQQAEEANRLAYIQQMLGKRNLAQELSAQGINGGATESALLQLAANYGNSVNNNNRSLTELLGQYGTQRSDAYAEKEQNIANALASLTGDTTEGQMELPKMSELYSAGIKNYAQLYDAMSNAEYTQDQIDSTWENYEKYVTDSDGSQTKAIPTFDSIYNQGISSYSQLYNAMKGNYTTKEIQDTWEAYKEYYDDVKLQKQVENYKEIASAIKINEKGWSKKEISKKIDEALDDNLISEDQAEELKEKYC